MCLTAGLSTSEGEYDTLAPHPAIAGLGRNN